MWTAATVQGAKLAQKRPSWSYQSLLPHAPGAALAASKHVNEALPEGEKTRGGREGNGSLRHPGIAC